MALVLRKLATAVDSSIVETLRRDSNMHTFISVALNFIDFEVSEVGLIELVFFIGSRTRNQPYKLTGFRNTASMNVIMYIFKSYPEFEAILHNTRSGASICNPSEFLSFLNKAFLSGKNAPKDRCPIFSHWKRAQYSPPKSGYDPEITIIQYIAKTDHFTEQEQTRINALVAKANLQSFEPETDEEESDVDFPATPPLYYSDIMEGNSEIRSMLSGLCTKIDSIESQLDTIYNEI